uniref:Uncharacterized protein n=1 Tax=viral metagenome TaxID=1070528 RepID=A0A6H1ZU68_9ZZZZ
MKINLNGQDYELKAGTGVRRTPIAEWPDNIRLDGQQQRKDRSLLSSWAIDSWQNGLGLERINVNLASNQYRLWDVENCDTRHPSHIVRSPAFNTCTIVPSRGDLNLKMDYLNNLYFVETEQATEGTTNMTSIGNAFQFTPPFSLGSYRAIGLAGNEAGHQCGTIRGLLSLEPKIAVICHGGLPAPAGTLGNRYTVIATLGGSLPNGIRQADMIGTLPITRYAQMEKMGGNIYILNWLASSNVVEFFMADAYTGTTVTRVGSSSSQIGSYLPPLITDGLTMYAQTPEGIYDFYAKAIEIDTSRSQDKNGSQVLFGQDLYFKNKKSLIYYDGTNTEGVGYDLDDGLPGDKWGEITAMCSTWKCIFAAVKGATYSHILTMEADHMWQYYARVPTPGIWVREMFLSDTPDNIDRLWCIFGNHNYPGYFLNPIINPLQAATYSYVPTGYFTPPIHDGGMAEVPAGYYDMSLTSDGVGGSNIVTMFYGLNGANPVSTLGVVSTNSFAHTFGSPYGLEGYRIQPKFMLAGASGTGPIFRESILHYLKVPNERLSFDFTIDIEKSSKVTPCPPEAIIGSLNFVRNNKLLMPFWYGQMGTKNVKVLESPVTEDVEDQRVYEGERKGFIEMKIGEIL